ncbi:MAG: RNA methyltransferase [Bacteroidota bacterium]
MISSNQIKYVRSLQQKKFRQKYNNFIVEGDKMAVEIMRERVAEVEQVFALASWIETHKKELAFCLNKTIIVSEKELGRISGLKSPNQVLVILRQWIPAIDEAQLSRQFSLYLDDIQDPGNMGTILRIADWFGIDYVFCSAGCAELYNPKVLQASMGAFLRVKVLRTELEQLRERLPALPLLGAMMEGDNVFAAAGLDKGLIIIGNEGRGIAEERQALLTHRLAIPRAEGRRAESLNAAVATGILCAALLNR